MHLFIVSLFIKAKILGSIQMSTKGEWINRLLYIIIVECSTAVQIMKQSRWVSKTWWNILWTNTYRIIGFMWISRISRVIEITSAFSGKKLGDELTAKRHKNSFWIIKYFMSWLLHWLHEYNHLSKHQTVHLKCVHFIICKLYLI